MFYVSIELIKISMCSNSGTTTMWFIEKQLVKIFDGLGRFTDISKTMVLVLPL